MKPCIMYAMQLRPVCRKSLAVALSAKPLPAISLPLFFPAWQRNIMLTPTPKAGLLMNFFCNKLSALLLFPVPAGYVLLLCPFGNLHGDSLFPVLCKALRHIGSMIAAEQEAEEE